MVFFRRKQVSFCNYALHLFFPFFASDDVNYPLECLIIALQMCYRSICENAISNVCLVADILY